MKNKVLISMLFGVLLAGGWYTQLKGNMEENSLYNQYVATGNERYEKTLYQEACKNYEAALDLKVSKKLEKQLINAYEAHYAESPSYGTQESLLVALEEACTNYPEESEFWERRIEVYLDTESYSKALEVCKGASEVGIKSEHYTELLKQVKYAYKEQNLYRPDYKEALNGYFLMFSGLDWEWVTSDGETDAKSSYTELGYINKEGVFLCTDLNGDTYFVDMDNIKRGVVDLEVTDFGVLSQGYCSVKYNDAYAFVNTDGEILAEGLQSCGCFQNNYAPVETDDGKWAFLGIDGEQHSVDVEEIVFDYAGRYLINETVIAKKDGVYQFFDSSLSNTKSKFTCKDIDVLTNDAIVAYQDDNGKWGYVGLDGKVVIEPEYDEAKSFSNGLAAVCMDGKWGVINKNNSLIVDYKYRYCGYMSDGGIINVMDDEEDYYKTIKFEFPDLIG